MDVNKIIALLVDYPKEHATAFAEYILKMAGDTKTEWVNKKSEGEQASLFKLVAKDGLVFDGKHISLQTTGISYDYVAYKNKMLLAYPESKVDMGIVYAGDKFSVAKESGSVIYTHEIANPFEQKEAGIIGAYCVIVNKRGEFLTLLSNDDIEKHRKVAKTDFIWKAWFKEMVLKTVIKKACKQHFADIYESIEEKDNENYSLDNPLDLDLKLKAEIDAINDIEALKVYYQANKGKGAAFDKYVTIRKEQLLSK